MLAVDTIEKRLEFARVPQGWAAVGSILLVSGLLYAVVFLYRHEQRAGAPARVRTFLAAMRCTVILALAVIWLEPILATYINRNIESATLLLLDGSASMSLRDLYPDGEDSKRVEKVLAGIDGADATTVSRTELVRAVLGGEDAKVLKQLTARNALQIYRFGDKVRVLGRFVGDGGKKQEGETKRRRDRETEGKKRGEEQGQASSSAGSQPADEGSRQEDRCPSGGGEFALGELAEANAPATDIGRAVRQAVAGRADKPVAAVVVFSDGQFNQGEPAEVVARYARAKKIPIHVVGVGDPSPPRNVAVSAVEVPPNVFVRDPFKVTAYLRAQGLNGTSLAVELLERMPDADETAVVESKQVAVRADGRVEPVVFTHQLGKAAETRLVVRAAQQEAETITDDNVKEVSVRALENKMQVLLIAGSPSWEYRYLARLLQRDATVNLSCWLQSADAEAVRDGNSVIDHFPREPEELYAYDCILLLDPQPDDFDPAWAQHVEDLVANTGSGLLYVAGRKNGPRFAHDPDTQALLELLPVVIDAGQADLIINELGHFQQTAWPLTVPAAVANHPVLAMSDQAGENARIWARLPGVYWHYPVRREKPVAAALLRHSNPRMRNAYGGHVLLATQFVGSGRAGFLGFETTWRWRRFGEKYFNRFWIQLLRHLVEGKLLSGQKRGLLQVERDRYAIGEPVEIEARLLDSRHLPLKQERVEASMRVGGQRVRPVVLEAQPNRPGWYRGRFVPTQIGTYVLRIDLPGTGGTEPATIRGEVHVGRPDLEFRQTQLDRRTLRTLASQSAGGEYLDIDEVDRLGTLIPSRAASLVLTGQPRPLWDRWWTLLLLVSLLGIEWAVRKRARLL